MGKSARKWIKTVLFGKMQSKSSISNNHVSDKYAAADTPVEDVSGNSPVILDFSQLNSGAKCVDIQSEFVSVPLDDEKMKKQVQAATRLQAVFRGHLARRAFWVLKGIIRLQAHIRGHLVRRQAAATLRCMKAIVNFQALVRGRRVRLSNASTKLKDSVVEVAANSFLGPEKRVTNMFVHKILVSLPTALPLSFQYEDNEPNSALNWLERWSSSHFWRPPAQCKKNLKRKTQKKLGGSQMVASDTKTSKRSLRKFSNAANRDNSTLASFEMDKPKQNLRKVSNRQLGLVQEHPQNEIERVKHNLKNISTSVAEDSEMPHVETEKPKVDHDVKSESSSSAPEKKIAVSHKLALLEAPEPKTMMEKMDSPQNYNPVVDDHDTDNGEKMDQPSSFHEESSSKVVRYGKADQRMAKRRSLPAEQEYPENISRSANNLPSYMAATECAKAKVKNQGISNFDEDISANGFVRRHSLPSSMGGKLSSLSPKIQKRGQGSSKGGSKTNKSLLASRDDMIVHPGWRR